MVNTRDHNRKQVREQCWLLLEVERERLVVAVPDGQRLFPLKQSKGVHLDVRHPDDDILELVVLPCVR